jgi:hypothetical protein
MGLGSDLTLCPPVYPDNTAEQLVYDAVTIEHEAFVRQLDWHKEVDDLLLPP